MGMSERSLNVGRPESIVNPTIRFSLRSLIVVTAALAALLALTPAAHRWITWAPHRDALHEWAAGLQRQPNRCESKLIQMPNGRRFSVHTAEAEIDDDGFTTTYSGKPVRSQGFFVVPPGEWVVDIPDVIRLWHEHRNYSSVRQQRTEPQSSASLPNRLEHGVESRHLIN